VLRANGRKEDAVELENTELARALAAARLSETPAGEEASIFAQEAERVLNASVLAELLAPMLAEELRASAHHVPAVPVSTATQAAPKPASVVRPAPLKSPSITDLLDGMLSQETTFNPTPVRP
jgi:hypothetical protein